MKITRDLIINMLKALGQEFTSYENDSRFGNTIFVNYIIYRCIFVFDENDELVNIKL